MTEILHQFCLSAEPLTCEPYGNGHINATYCVVCRDGEKYILQKINTSIFLDPEALMRNIRLVTDHLANSGACRREVLTLVPTLEGLSYYTAEDGGCWRVYEFVKDSACLERADTPEQFAESAAAFGRFFNQLSDFDAALLTETIPHFHDTPMRLEALKKAVAADRVGRVKTALPEIGAAMEQETFSRLLTDLHAQGQLPLRVTHNDTKINNVLFDAVSMRGLCVIDLDTVMPGLILNDFGDSIRFGASTAAEDEKDVDRVNLDLGLFEAYVKTYLATCGQALTPLEIELLPAGAKMMTYECGVRFLTDYLVGDTYFHTAYPEHNLHRARTQFKLVRDMDKQWQNMQRIVEGAKKS